MQINHDTGVIFDAIAYTTNHFNMDKVREYHKTFVKNESDIFANFHEFRKSLGVEPSDNLYLFFIFNPHKYNVMISYIEKCFPDFNYSEESVLKEIRKIEKFKKFVYNHLLDTYAKSLDIEAVINGDYENTATAIAFLATDFPKQAMQIKTLFYNFEELVFELITYLKFIIQKVMIYNKNKSENTFETIANDFVNSERVKELKKHFYFEEKHDLSKQTFAISFFRSFVIKAPADEFMSYKSTVIIGDKSIEVTGWYENLKHITRESAVSIFTIKIINNIINVLMTKGEKSITQLCTMLPHDRSNITRYIKILRDEKMIDVAYKNGNEFFYKINYPYFRIASSLMQKSFEGILDNDKSWKMSDYEYEKK